MPITPGTAGRRSTSSSATAGCPRERRSWRIAIVGRETSPPSSSRASSGPSSPGHRFRMSCWPISAASRVNADFAIKPWVRALLTHAEFYTSAVRAGRVRTPVEYVVAALAATGRRSADATPLWLMEGMGQRPLYPPNVSGWRHKRLLDQRRRDGEAHRHRPLVHVEVDAGPTGTATASSTSPGAPCRVGRSRTPTATVPGISSIGSSSSCSSTPSRRCARR